MITRWTLLAVAVALLGAGRVRADNEAGRLEPVAQPAGPVNGMIMEDEPEVVAASERHETGTVARGIVSRWQCRRAGSCRGGRLWEWLTYRPLTRPTCCCCKTCAPCGLPPLYTFFLCDRYGKPACSSCAAAVATRQGDKETRRQGEGD